MTLLVIVPEDAQNKSNYIGSKRVCAHVEVVLRIGRRTHREIFGLQSRQVQLCDLRLIFALDGPLCDGDGDMGFLLCLDWLDVLGCRGLEAHFCQTSRATVSAAVYLTSFLFERLSNRINAMFPANGAKPIKNTLLGCI